MHRRITFRNMDHSKVMEQYAQQQLEKIELFLQENERTPIYIDLIFEPSKIHEHPRVELRVKSPNFDLVSNYEHKGVDFYDVLDRVIDIMYRELLEKNKKMKVDDPKMVGRHEEFKKQR